ncbi:hypothetical protein AMTRI_Chr13g118110 [Amborella trichopoda]
MRPVIPPPIMATWGSSERGAVNTTCPQHSICVFHNKRAFDSCNFTEATVLDQGYSGSFTLLASHPGIFYFACDKSMEGAFSHCLAGQKVAITVHPPMALHFSAPENSGVPESSGRMPFITSTPAASLPTSSAPCQLRITKQSIQTQ